MAEILDETDLLILKTLQKNAKLTTKELADAVHLTPTPVFERLKRLEKRGYIKKYVAILDPDKLGQSLLVFCKVKLQERHYDFFIFGHRHRVENEAVGENSRYLVIGEWIENRNYAVFDGGEIEVRDFAKE